MSNFVHPCLLQLLPLLFFVLVLLFCASCQSASVDLNPEDKASLLLFRSWIQDPVHGLSTWFGSNCTNWTGLACQNHTGQVISINLRNVNLSGYIHPNLCNLLFLETLVLSENGFTGQIPLCFGRLQNLKTLDLSHNRFGGVVPDSLVRLRQLKELSLNGPTTTMGNEIAKAVESVTQVVESVVSVTPPASLTKKWEHSKTDGISALTKSQSQKLAGEAADSLAVKLGTSLFGAVAQAYENLKPNRFLQVELQSSELTLTQLDNENPVSQTIIYFGFPPRKSNVNVSQSLFDVSELAAEKKELSFGWEKKEGTDGSKDEDKILIGRWDTGHYAVYLQKEKEESPLELVIEVLERQGQDPSNPPVAVKQLFK